MVTVIINGKTVEVRDEAWAVLMAAWNWMVDTGDAFAILGDRFPAEDIAAAREASGELALATEPVLPRPA